MNTLKDFLKIVDAHMIAVILLSLLMTFVCSRLDFQADLPSSFVGIAIVFPDRISHCVRTLFCKHSGEILPGCRLYAVVSLQHCFSQPQSYSGRFGKSF